MVLAEVEFRFQQQFQLIHWSAVVPCSCHNTSAKAEHLCSRKHTTTLQTTHISALCMNNGSYRDVNHARRRCEQFG